MLLEASVNRTVCIDSLEKKANCNGLDWRFPKNFREEIIPEMSPRTGKKLGYDRHIDSIVVKDFDGDKQVVRSRFFNEDGTERGRNPIIGIEKGNPRYRNSIRSFYGYRSNNFQAEVLSVEQVIETLKDGYSIAPGLHNPSRSPSGSYRSRLSLERLQFLFLDADEWDNIGGIPKHYEELLERFPDIENDFFYVGESISSRSDLKPYLNLRLGVLLPKPIVNSKKKSGSREDEFFNQIVKFFVTKYPFVSKAVSRDISRQSFGNARPDAWHKQFDNVMPRIDFEYCKKKAVSVKRELRKKEKEKQEELARINNRQVSKSLKEDELVRKGILKPIPYDYYKEMPLNVYKNSVNVAELLEKKGLIEPIDSRNYRWHESSSHISMTFRQNMTYINVWSSSMKKYFPPMADPNYPISAVRFIIYYEFGYDIENLENEQLDHLNKVLSKQGFGVYTSRGMIEEYEKKIDELHENMKRTGYE